MSHTPFLFTVRILNVGLKCTGIKFLILRILVGYHRLRKSLYNVLVSPLARIGSCSDLILSRKLLVSSKQDPPALKSILFFLHGSINPTALMQA